MVMSEQQQQQILKAVSVTGEQKTNVSENKQLPNKSRKPRKNREQKKVFTFPSKATLDKYQFGYWLPIKPAVNVSGLLKPRVYKYGSLIAKSEHEPQKAVFVDIIIDDTPFLPKKTEIVETVKKSSRNLITEQKQQLKKVSNVSELIGSIDVRDDFLTVRTDINLMMLVSEDNLEHLRTEAANVIKELSYKISVASLELGKGISEEDMETVKKADEDRFSRYADLLRSGKATQAYYDKLCKEHPKVSFTLRKNKYYQRGRGKLRKSFDPEALYKFASRYGLGEEKTKRLSKILVELEKDNCIGSLRSDKIREFKEIAQFSREYIKISGNAQDSLETILSENESIYRKKIQRFSLRVMKYKYRLALIKYVKSVRSGVKTTEAVDEIAKTLNTTSKNLREFILFEL